MRTCLIVRRQRRNVADANDAPYPLDMALSPPPPPDHGLYHASIVPATSWRRRYRRPLSRRIHLRRSSLKGGGQAAAHVQPMDQRDLLVRHVIPATDIPVMRNITDLLTDCLHLQTNEDGTPICDHQRQMLHQRALNAAGVCPTLRVVLIRKKLPLLPLDGSVDRVAWMHPLPVVHAAM